MQEPKRADSSMKGEPVGIWSGHGAGQTQTSVPSSTCKSCCVTQNIISKVVFLPRRFMLSITSISPGPAVWLNFTIPFQKNSDLSHSYQMRSKNAKKDMQITHAAPRLHLRREIFRMQQSVSCFLQIVGFGRSLVIIITRGDMSPSLLETENVHCQCFWEIIITFQRSVLWWSAFRILPQPLMSGFLILSIR